MHDTILNPKFIFEVMDCPPMTCPTMTFYISWRDVMGGHVKE